MKKFTFNKLIIAKAAAILYMAVAFYFLGFTIGSRTSIQQNKPLIVGSKDIQPYFFGQYVARYKLGIAGNPYDTEQEQIDFIKGYITQLEMDKLIPK